jgi:hypothetical protein
MWYLGFFSVAPVLLHDLHLPPQQEYVHPHLLLEHPHPDLLPGLLLDVLIHIGPLMLHYQLGAALVFASTYCILFEQPW